MRALTAILVSSRLATLVEMQSVLGVRDAYDLLEIILVDDHNQRVMQKHANNH